MKKFLAGLLAAAMVAAPSAAFADETGAQGFDADIVVGVEYQGTNLEGTFNVQSDAEGDTALNFNLGVPAGEQSMSVDLPDFIRYVGDELFVNVKGVADFYQMITGDTSVTEALTAVGVDGWVEIPPLNIVWNEEAINALQQKMNLQPSEQLMASLSGIAAALPITQTEEEIVITVNNDAIIGIAEAVDKVIADNKEEISGFLSLADPSPILNVIDYKATFGEYVAAYARGRASVTGENADAIVNEIFGYLNMGIGMLSQTLKTFTLKVNLDEVPDLSDSVAKALESVVIDGKITIATNTSIVDGAVSVTANEQTVDFTLHAEPTQNGINCVASASQNGQVLASSELNIAVNGNAIDATFNVTSAGETVVDFALKAETSNEAASLLISLTAGGKTGEFVFEAHPLEGAEGFNGTYSLTLDGQKVVSGTANGTRTEEGIQIDLTVEAEGKTAQLNLLIQQTGIKVDASMLENGQVVESISAYANVKLNEVPADLDITAPENAITVFDLISNVSALYYSMQQAQDEAATQGAQQ